MRVDWARLRVRAKPKPSRIRRRRNTDCPDEEEDEAMIGAPDPNKAPAQIQGKKLDE